LKRSRLLPNHLAVRSIKDAAFVWASVRECPLSKLRLSPNYDAREGDLRLSACSRYCRCTSVPATRRVWGWGSRCRWSWAWSLGAALDLSVLTRFSIGLLLLSFVASSGAAANSPHGSEFAAAFSSPGVVSPASAARAIAAASGHTCALTSAGGVKCWGSNYFGQLGDGTTTDRHTPVDVSGLQSGVAALAAGFGHTCALTSAGGVTCLGWNAYGQLGDGTTIERHTPVDVSGLQSGVAALAAGDFHTCALTSAGGVKCWGRNEYGQLGDGTTTDRNIPVAVSGLASGVVALAAGEAHTCAVTNDGGVQCWGDNSSGQLGDGTTTVRITPVAVVGFGAPQPQRNCVVPDVIGRLLARAKTRIIKTHCRVGTVRRKRSTLKKKGRVLAQNPAPGKKFHGGARVNLIVGKGPKRA
jgi:hypothetical protein